MYSRIEMTTYAYTTILSHLVDLEERKDEIVSEFYPEPSALRDNYSCFLDNYLKKLEELVEKVQIIDKPSCEKLKSLNYLPYVIIGSSVELEDLRNLSTHIFRIVSPYDTGSSKIDLSYQSAFGKALMLKKPGDVVNAEINKDVCAYKIKSIRY